MQQIALRVNKNLQLWKYSKLSGVWPWVVWSTLRVESNLEDDFALSKGLDQMASRGSLQPKLIDGAMNWLLFVTEF